MINGRLLDALIFLNVGHFSFGRTAEGRARRVCAKNFGLRLLSECVCASGGREESEVNSLSSLIRNGRGRARR